MPVFLNFFTCRPRRLAHAPLSYLPPVRVAHAAFLAHTSLFALEAHSAPPPRARMSRQTVATALERLIKLVPHPGVLLFSPPVFDDDGQETYAVRMCFHMAQGTRREELQKILETHCSARIAHNKRRAECDKYGPVATGDYERAEAVYMTLADLTSFLWTLADMYDSIAMTHAQALHAGKHHGSLQATAGFGQFLHAARGMNGCTEVGSLTSNYIKSLGDTAGTHGVTSASPIAIGSSVPVVPGVPIDPRRIVPLLMLAVGCAKALDYFEPDDPCKSLLQAHDNPAEVATTVLEQAGFRNIDPRRGGISAVLPHVPRDTASFIVSSSGDIVEVPPDAMQRGAWFAVPTCTLHKHGVPCAAMVYQLDAPTNTIRTWLAICDAVTADGCIRAAWLLFDGAGTTVNMAPLIRETGMSDEDLTAAASTDGMLWRLVVASTTGRQPVWPSASEAIAALKSAEPAVLHKAIHSLRSVIDSEAMLTVRKLDASSPSSSRDRLTASLNAKRKRTKNTMCFEGMGDVRCHQRDIQKNPDAMRMVQGVLRPIIEETLTRPCADVEAIKRLVDLVAMEMKVMAMAQQVAKRGRTVA